MSIDKQAIADKEARRFSLAMETAEAVMGWEVEVSPGAAYWTGATKEDHINAAKDCAIAARKRGPDGEYLGTEWICAATWSGDCRLWRPDLDLDAAWDVIEKMVAEGFRWRADSFGGGRFMFYREDGEVPHYTQQRCLPASICLAALAALAVYEPI